MTKCGVQGCERPKNAHGFCGMHAARSRRNGDPLKVLRVREKDPYEKMLLLGFNRNGECLTPKLKPNLKGYVQISIDGKMLSAHRISYEKWHGEIPDGMTVDHICHNEASHRGECDGGASCSHRSCVNPAHLRLAGSSENALASASSGAARQRQKTHCAQGHPFDEKNTHYRSNGNRVCRQCATDRVNKRRREVCQTK